MANFQVICENCGYTSPVFLRDCPQCHSSLTPLELKRYFDLRETVDRMEKEGMLTPTILLEMADEKVRDTETIDFILIYFKRYYLDFLYNVFVQYYHNFRSMLRADFLYEFVPLVQTELDYLSKRIDEFKKEKESLPQSFNLIENYKYLDLYEQARRLLKRHSSSMIRDSEISEQKYILNFLIHNALNDLIKKVKTELNWDKTEDLDSILEFRNFLYQLQTSEEIYYKKVPKVYLELTNYNNFFKILQEYDVELLYLPREGNYVIVEKQFTPEMQKIAELCKEGGIGFKDVIQEFKIPPIQAELILQLLLKKRMMVHTYSFLYGDQFYLRQDLGRK